jgi:AcrR family transcriptional regulator
MARPPSDIKPRLLAAARARFLREGVDGASLRSIAKDAETNIGMVYYYFPTKEDLFDAVVSDIYEGLLEDVNHSLEGDGRSFTSRLRDVSARFGEMSSPELDVMRLVIREVLVGTERRERIFDRFTKGHVGTIARELARAVERGEVREDLPLPVIMASLAGLLVIPQLLRRVVGARSQFVLALLPSASDLADALIEIFRNGAAADRVTDR